MADEGTASIAARRLLSLLASQSGAERKLATMFLLMLNQQNNYDQQNKVEILVLRLPKNAGALLNIFATPELNRASNAVADILDRSDLDGSAIRRRVVAMLNNPKLKEMAIRLLSRRSQSKEHAPNNVLASTHPPGCCSVKRRILQLADAVR